MTDALAIVHAWAQDLELEVTKAEGGQTLMVSLPGTQRKRVSVSFTVTPQALVIECFVARGTDEDTRALYEFLLRRNLKAFGAAYCIDAHGDVYLVGRVANTGLTREALDLVVGSVLGMADGDFNTILELAYPEAIAREWQWRLDRGESTANLAAFEHLRPQQ